MSDAETDVSGSTILPITAAEMAMYPMYGIK